MSGDRIFRAADGAALRFDQEAVKNNFQSERAGRPIFDNMLYVEVMTPGSNESIPRFEVERTYCPEAGKGDGPGGRIIQRTDYYERFKEAVEKYKAEEGGIGVDGTPIDELPTIDRATVATFKALGIFSVEMLASVSDGNLGNLGIGGMVMREQARQFLVSRQFGIPSAQLAADKAHLETEVLRLTKELKAANAQIAQLTAAKASAKPAKPTADPLASPPTADPLAPPPPADNGGSVI